MFSDKSSFRGLSGGWYGRLLAVGIGLACFLPATAQAQVAFTGTPPVTLGSGFASPNGVAVDAAGDVFVADTSNSAVKEMVAVNGSIPPNPTILTLGSGFSQPRGVAVDAAGDVFVADSNSDAVKEMVAVNGSIPATSPTILRLGSGFASPFGVAVDATGDVFVADKSNAIDGGAVYELVAVNGSIPPIPTTLTLASGLSPTGVAVDAAGDVFVADFFNQAMKEIVAENGCIPAKPTIRTLSGGFDELVGVSVDAAGDVFVADEGNHAVYELVAVNGSIPVTNPAILTLGNGFSVPLDVSVNAAGDVFVTDGPNNAVKEFQAGSVNFGSANVCPSGHTAPAPCSQMLTLNYQIAAGTTIGSVKVLTTGASRLDFQAQANDTSTTLCTAQTDNSATSCTVDVTFAPFAPGQRKGAVEILDGSGNALTTTPIYGMGTGPAVAFSPSNTVTLSSGFTTPQGVAVDATGDVFLTDSSAVYEMVAVNGAIPANPNIQMLGSGFSGLEGVAVDGAGDVFFAYLGSGVDGGNNGAGAVQEMVAVNGSIPATTPAILTLGSGFATPAGVAVDAAGDVFVADFFGNAVKEIVAVNGSIPANPAILTLGSGFSGPFGVAVDAAGDVFASDYGNDAVKEIVAVNGSIPSNPTILTLSSGFSGPEGVAVDAAGDVFVADFFGNAVKEIAAVNGSIPANPTILTLGSGFAFPTGVAVDAAGDVFVVDTGNNAVKEIIRSAPPSLSFASTPVGSTSGSSQSVQLQNVGNAALTLSGVLSDTIDFSQVAGSSTPQDCELVSTSLNPGAQCNISLIFNPRSGGPLNATMTLTDNALNGNPATQTINLGGTGIQASQTITFTGLPATATYGSAGPYTLNGTASSGLAVSYIVTGPATLSGTTLTIAGAGTVSVTATQAGNPDYAAATPVSQTIDVITPGQLSVASLITIPTVAVRGSETANVTVTNIGGSSLTFTASIIGPNYSVLTTGGTCTGSLAAGASCILPVSFHPPGVGTHTVPLIFTPSAGTAVTAKLRGLATGIGDISESSLNFGSVPIGTSSTLAVTFENFGVSGSPKFTATPNNTNYSVAGSTCNSTGLTSGQTCTLTIKFAPAKVGAHNAGLTIQPNAGASTDIKLLGTGAPPPA